jgi:hypothetical protein
MAIAGGATTAYLVQRRGDGFTIARRTTLSDLCDEPDAAWEKFIAGEPVYIRGDKVIAFRERCEAWTGQVPTVAQ